MKIFSIFLFMLFSGICVEIPVNSDAFCPSSGEDTYFINTNVTLNCTEPVFSNASPIFVLNSSGLIFDCNYTFIFGNGSNLGLLIEGKNNISFLNCNFQNFSTAINISNSGNEVPISSVNNNFTNSSYGILAINAVLNISSNAFENLSYGIFSESNGRVEAYLNIFNHVSKPVFLKNLENFTFLHNSISLAEFGFYIENATNGSIIENIVSNSTIGIFVNQTSEINLLRCSIYNSSAADIFLIDVTFFNLSALIGIDKYYAVLKTWKSEPSSILLKALNPSSLTPPQNYFLISNQALLYLNFSSNAQYLPLALGIGLPNQSTWPYTSFSQVVFSKYNNTWYMDYSSFANSKESFQEVGPNNLPFNFIQLNITVHENGSLYGLIGEINYSLNYIGSVYFNKTSLFLNVSNISQNGIQAPNTNFSYRVYYPNSTLLDENTSALISQKYEIRSQSWPSGIYVLKLSYENTYTNVSSSFNLNDFLNISANTSYVSLTKGSTFTVIVWSKYGQKSVTPTYTFNNGVCYLVSANESEHSYTYNCIPQVAGTLLLTFSATTDDCTVSGPIVCKMSQVSNSTTIAVISNEQQQQSNGGGGTNQSGNASQNQTKIISGQKGEIKNITLENKTVFLFEFWFNSSGNVSFQYTESFQKPQSIIAPNNSVYLFFDIQITNSSILSNLSLQFNVSKSWLSQRNASWQDIILLKYFNNSWYDIPIEKIGENDIFYTFKARLSNFSWFAIALQNYSANIQGNKTSEGQNNVTSQNQTSFQESVLDEKIILILCIVLVLIGVAIYFIFAKPILQKG
ncbi:MAG: PGF-pre-PGF domain-containing protein [archaeon]